MNLLSIILLFGIAVLVGRYGKDPMTCYLIGYFTCTAIVWIESRKYDTT